MNKVKYLITYRYSELIHDLTIEFTKRYILGSLSNLGNFRPDYRQADQMNQAARSGKQNIVEGVGQGQTSSKGLIKLLGVASASFEELIMDYEDFLRQNKLKLYPKDSLEVAELKRIAFRLSHLSNLDDLGNLKERPVLFGESEKDANFLLTLCHTETYLLSKQIKAAEDKFLKRVATPKTFTKSAGSTEVSNGRYVVSSNESFRAIENPPLGGMNQGEKSHRLWV